MLLRLPLPIICTIEMQVAKGLMPYMTMARDPYELAKGADALIVLTPWNEFMQIDMQRIKNAMHTPVLVDGRNLYDPVEMKALGFVYRGMGRGYDGVPLE
jgi:UDPglucose 6-dehydrogenase